jgi:type II secretory pathway pseudopilin PulG
MKSQRSSAAFTLLELIVITLIIAVLIALLQPVFVRAVEEAKKGKSMSNMHQIHLALMIYIDASQLNAPYQMPTNLSQITSNKEILHTGGIPRVSSKANSDVYRYMVPVRFPGMPEKVFNDALSAWSQHIDKSNQNPIFIVDDTFNEKPDSAREFFSQTFAMGMYFQGNCIRRKKIGDPGTYEFWAN